MDCMYIQMSNMNHNKLIDDPGLLAWSPGEALTCTLQELKLQGIKIRDGVVLSRYSRA